MNKTYDDGVIAGILLALYNLYYSYDDWYKEAARDLITSTGIRNERQTIIDLVFSKYETETANDFLVWLGMDKEGGDE